MKLVAYTIVLAALAAVLAGCAHVQPSTGLTYILHTDYAVFNVDEDPVHPVSNYIGYCLLPMKDADDERADTIRSLCHITPW